MLIADKAIPAGTGAKVLAEEKYVREDRMPAETLPEGVLSDVPADLEALVTTAAVQPGQLLTAHHVRHRGQQRLRPRDPGGQAGGHGAGQVHVFSPSLSAGAQVVDLLHVHPGQRRTSATRSPVAGWSGPGTSTASPGRC